MPLDREAPLQNRRMQKSFTPMTLDARIDRLESTEAIRQLAYRYALAIDVRDLDAVVSLYDKDIHVGKETRGRDALKAVFDRVLRGFTVTSHQVQNHVIEFDDADSAQGLVTCRCEHEVVLPSGEREWVVLQNLYHDKYRRTDGHWYFGARVQNRLYATTAGDPPVGEFKDRWPGAEPSPALFHAPFDAWREFWGDQPVDTSLAPWSPELNFIHRLRRGAVLPSLATHIARATAEVQSESRTL